MPKLTVILPARNAESTVKRAVSSTLTAMPEDAELVVLNDGSTDRTSAVLETFSDSRLRILESSGSGGVAAALNMLLQKTDSQFVARMDADDIGLPWRFKTAMPALERGTDVVFAPVVEFTGKRLRPSVPLPISEEAFRLHLLLSNPVSHPTMIARRAVLEEVDGYREVPAEDYDLWLRMAAAGVRQQRIGAWGLLYRLHPKQITASKQWRQDSWASAEQAEAFADASQRVLGRRLRRLVQISALPKSQGLEELAAFEAALRLPSERIRGVQGAFLSHRIRERTRWTRDKLVSSQSSSIIHSISTQGVHDE